MGETDGKKLKIARRMLLLTLLGKPTEHLREQYPDIARRMQDYLLAKTFNTLPRAGGLEDQWIDDYDYLMVFLSTEGEVNRIGRK